MEKKSDMNFGKCIVEVNDASRASINSDLVNKARSMTWAKIRRTLFMASTRGNDEIIRVFWQALQEEALFDDQGAWCRK